MAGGGVPEAMLIGAAVGAGTGGVMSAVKDEDPLQGALLGAALGAAGGGIGSFAGGAASGAASGAAEGAVTSQLPQSAISSALASDATKAAALQGVQSSIPSISSSTSLLGPGGAAIPGIGSAAPSGLGNLTAGQYTGLFGQAPQTGAALSQGLTQAPAQTSASGLGTGMFPKLTNAQVYGAGIGGGLMGLVGQSAQNQDNMAPEPEPYTGPLSYFKYSPQTFRPSVAPGYASGGGITDLDIGMGQSTMRNTIDPVAMMAHGGISHLGSYSDGGRMLRGPGDGMSDDIPGVIAGKQPARLADGEFVVPADVVSHLGNGSTDAGAKKLYSMMDSVRKARTGSKKQGRQIKADKYVPGMARGGRVEDGIVKLAGGGEWTDPYLVPTTQGGFLDVGNANGVSADQVQAMIDATRKTTAGMSSNFQPTGYTPSDRYTPYTMANRPSSTAPQYYQDIYKGAGAPDFSTPGYTLAGNLGRWSNVAGEQQRAMQPASVNQQVTQAYLQNLGRAPETTGFNYWMGSGLSRPELDKAFQQSAEYQVMTPGAISDMYQKYLGRAPEQSGLDFWTERLKSGAATPAQVQAAIAGSEEAKARNAPKEEEKKYRGGIASLV